MKISCPACSAKYQIADEKVRDRLAKIRCRKCGATIVIDGKVDPPQVATADAAAAGDAGGEAGAGGGEPGPGEYSVDLGEGEPVNMSVAGLVEAYNSGTITADTYVWKDGMADWQQLGEVAEVVQALNNASSTPAAAPVAAAPAAAAGLGLGVGAAAFGQSAQRAATRSGAGRAAATDLFGGIETAGSEEDVTTSAPDPSPPSAAGSLFGSGAGATGARNESSVLFSLSALTGTPGAAAPPLVAASASASTASSSDDSGLIDLKALAATAAPTPDAAAMPAPMPFAMGNAPFGIAAPLGGVPAAPPVTADDLMTARRSSKGPYVIGGSIAVVGLALAAAIFFSSSGKDEETAAAGEALAPAAAAESQGAAREGSSDDDKTSEKADEKKAEGESAKEEPDESAKEGEAEKSVEAAKRSAPQPATKRTYTAPKRAPRATAAPTPEPKPAPAAPKATAAPKKKTVKKKSACNCAPSDLMCAMRCSAR